MPTSRRLLLVMTALAVLLAIPVSASAYAPGSDDFVECVLDGNRGVDCIGGFFEDWPDQRDGGRELHVEDGLAAIAEGWEHNLGVVAAPGADGALVTTDAYRLARITLGAGEVLPAAAAGTARVCIVLDGGLVWDDPDVGPRTRARTECVLLPAACATPARAGDTGATVLVATP